jgi:hypothetical protein
MSTWHVPDSVLVAWMDGNVPLATAASVEQHIERCEVCQQSVAAVSATMQETADLDLAWQGIRDRIEPQPKRFTERALLRVGVSEENALVITGSTALVSAWLGALVLVTAFSLFASGWEGERETRLFLMLAPLAPMAGVAAAYGSDENPVHELTLAAPYSKLRLLLMRTWAVLVVCVPLSVLAAIPLQGPWWIAVAWLLPALAFVSLTLAATTVASPHYAASAIGLVWVLLTAPAVVGREPFDVMSATAMVLYAVLAIAGLSIFAARIDSLATDWRIG